MLEVEEDEKGKRGKNGLNGGCWKRMIDKIKGRERKKHAGRGRERKTWQKRPEWRMRKPTENQIDDRRVLGKGFAEGVLKSLLLPP